MLTRRKVVVQGFKAASTMLSTRLYAPLLVAQGQTGTSAHPATDEMTVDSAPQPQHFPPPDYGALPAELPPETKALRGSNSLKQYARRHGLLAGAAVVARGLEADPALQQLVAEQYDLLVPEGELKWRALRPSQDRFDFTQSDALLAFADKHHMQLRGHTLVWHNSVPDWLQQNAESLDVRQHFIDHITTVCTHYAGKLQSWDVVNEAVLPKDGKPGGLRNSFWYEHVGPDYIELAYRTARAADPHGLLTYNDYGVEYDNAEHAEHRTVILNLLRDLKSRNVPLDAVGIQSHIKAGSPDAIGKGLVDFMQSIQQMGLQIFLTELDVNEDDIVANDVTTRDVAIAKTYSDFLRVALANPAVKVMLTWGISDRRTWLNDGPTHHRKQPNRPQRSLPFDEQYRPAKAYFAIRDSLDQRSFPPAHSFNSRDSNDKIIEKVG